MNFIKIQTTPFNRSLLSRVGQKRAIIAIARHLVILARRLILDQSFYQPPLLKTT